MADKSIIETAKKMLLFDQLTMILELETMKQDKEVLQKINWKKRLTI